MTKIVTIATKATGRIQFLIDSENIVKLSAIVRGMSEYLVDFCPFIINRREENSFFIRPAAVDFFAIDEPSRIAVPANKIIKPN